MINRPAIIVDGLSKRYRIGAQQTAYRTFREAIADAVTAPLRRLQRAKESNDTTFWALQDVNFEVQPGEVVGIIGRNGAGKSTLLKVLSRITRPTAGQVRVRGRVASLLEVGTGFHPELTGRENVFLNGAILGMQRLEIQRKFDEIVDFAEMEKFIDTPVKRYSSGMYLRLAFAVAAHLEPEILVVDEVLAVGDQRFQNKCLGKIEQVSSSGRTILFVSHSMSAITRLCRSAILLERGRIACTGKSERVVRYYLEAGDAPGAIRQFDSGTSQVRLIEARVLDQAGIISDAHAINQPISIQITYRRLEEGLRVDSQVALYGEMGNLIFLSSDHVDNRRKSGNYGLGLCQSTVTIPANLLSEGTFFVRVSLWNSLQSGAVYAREHDALSFTIADPADGTTVRGDWAGEWPGVVRPMLKWNTVALS